MSITLPPLPYEKDGLAPHISSETIDYHYGKHHAGYVTKINQLIAGTEHEGKSVEEIMLSAPAGAIYNNAAQIWNHTFYWNSMAPNAGGVPTGAVADLINSSFGNFDEFKAKFSATAANHFGSGWAWLVKKGDKLEIVGTHDAGNPLKDGSGIPLITADVWEHAYYIDYRNARATYLEAFWKLVNWEWANAKLAEASS